MGLYSVNGPLDYIERKIADSDLVKSQVAKVQASARSQVKKTLEDKLKPAFSTGAMVGVGVGLLGAIMLSRLK